MRRIIAITQLSLDGIMQSPGGPDEDPSNGFKFGGWVMTFGDDALGEVIGEILANDFEMLLGRRTYEIFTAYWPYNGDNPIGEAFNNAKKYVATRTLKQLDWENSVQLGEDIVTELRQLKGSDGPDLHIWGSSNLLQTLIAADLIDEYCIWHFPVVLGKGKRLFENGVPPAALKLASTQCTPNGIFINRYHPGQPFPSKLGLDESPSPVELQRRKKLAAEGN